MRTIFATRYVTPLREGGSMPAIVEADDEGLYVLKFRGAGQGTLALLSEVVAGEIARALGLRVPEIVFATLDEAFGRNEPDPEIRHLIRASIGQNLAMDFLPGSLTFDPAAGDTPDAETASRTVWFDSFVHNVDRTARNANLLMWHRKLYCIDHGAALFFHHGWTAENHDSAALPFPQIKDHVLLPWATELQKADAHAKSVLHEDLFRSIVAQVPEDWLPPVFADAATAREAYVRHFTERLKQSAKFTEEAAGAHALLV